MLEEDYQQISPQAYSDTAVSLCIYALDPNVGAKKTFWDDLLVVHSLPKAVQLASNHNLAVCTSANEGFMVRQIICVNFPYANTSGVFTTHQSARLMLQKSIGERERAVQIDTRTVAMNKFVRKKDCVIEFKLQNLSSQTRSIQISS